MITNEIAISLIQDSLDGLHEASMIDLKITVIEKTPLFGGESNIDSMSFVALMTDVEDKLSQLTGKEIYVVLTDIEDLYPDANTLTVGMLTNYLCALAND